MTGSISADRTIRAPIDAETRLLSVRVNFRKRLQKNDRIQTTPEQWPLVTGLDVGTGLEFIDLEVSTLLHIDISIYSALSEILSSPPSPCSPRKE